MTEELKPCPFCGEVPDLPSGDGTQYEIECGNCAMAMASVQICDLMTGDERSAEKFTNYRYSEQYVERAKAEAIKQWNTRATLSHDHIEDGEEVEVVAWADPSDLNLMRRHGHTSCVVKAAQDVCCSEPLMTVAQHQRIVAALRDELETERMRLAGCGVAALGYFDGCADPYRSASLEEVLRLRERCDALSAPPAAMAYKDDPRKPHELSAAGCRCVRFGEGNPHWPCHVHSISAPPAAGTTSDQYRAELYDEVWQKARDLGYGNVTDALVELERIKAAPPAAGVPEGWKLVPIKPTAEMKAACRVAGKTKVWADMLAAAPTPPASEQQHDGRLLSELEVLTKDAERYRWLRTYCYGALTGYEMSDLFSHNDEIIDEKIDELLRLNPHLAKGEGV